MQIEMGRLLLRDFTQNDVQAVHTFDSDPELRRYRGGGRATEEDTHAFIERMQQWQREEPRPTYAFAVVLKASAEIIECQTEFCVIAHSRKARRPGLDRV